MPRLIDLTSSIYRKVNAGVLVLLIWLMAAGRGAAQETNIPPGSSETIITNMAQYWALTPAEKVRQQHARLELTIYFCDTNWTVFWGQSDGVDNFLPLRGLPRPLKGGEKVLIDGVALPVSQEFLWDKTTITVLSETNRIETIPAAGKLSTPAALQSHFVEMEALVDSVLTASAEETTVNLLVENTYVQAFVHHNAGETNLDVAGKIIRIHGVYSASLDPFGKIVSLTLWTPGWNQVEIIGSLEEDPRFASPLVSSKDFVTADPTSVVHVAGEVRRQQIGEAVTIWDDMGQIQVLSKQRQPLQVGDRIEAVGYPEAQGYDRILHTGLFHRVAGTPAEADNNPPKPAILHLADQVRGLDQKDLALHPKVSLEGVVTWVDARANFMFVQDSSGGIRVRTAQLQNGRRIRANMIVAVDGIATAGDFAPAVTNAVVHPTGTMNLPDAPLVSLEQALTGTEDGHWIQLRGYVRKVTPRDGGLELEMVAPGGEFIARLSKQDAGDARPGSIILVRGVCVAIANARRQLTGVEIWSTVPGSIQTEQFAPADPFDQPESSIASLRQFNLFNTLNKRVRTSGIVTLQVPGHYLCLQDGDESLLALSSQTEPLHLGDRVDVVGFSGTDGDNYLLREAVYRRISSGPEPAPVPLGTLQTVNEDLDGLMVSIGGLLLDDLKKPGETRLVIQGRDHIFEAKLDEASLSAQSGPLPEDKLRAGSKIAVTGVYRIQRDESGKPQSFLLNLRNVNDIRVVTPPPWWTLGRVLVIMIIGLPVFLLGVFWTWQTRRKNRLLQRAQVELKIAHDKLEERVAERTRELNEESEGRKRALTRLSEAQQRLILASRQAGMAEVATGILHNVGNILNSVNVSASVISDSVQRLRIEKFSKAMQLLTEQNGNLAAFLTADPRGHALPGYLHKLADNMIQQEGTLHSELKSLAKQIDHVKAVVALQQGYARSSGFYESLNPADLMEDALQINQAAYQRHAIEVVREFEQLPPITTDRHKVLQILINVLNNAKQALAECDDSNRRVVLRLYRQGDDHVRFEVSDTGAGISAENLDRIFSLGFTTKASGHGFGLHSGANSAKEMGGRLFVISKGTGLGATFVLELPVQQKSRQPAPVEMEVI